jgi:hypothetical protein
MVRVAVEHEDLELLRTQFINLAEALRNEINERFKLLEHTTDAIEKQLALITVSLGEHGTLLEGLIAIVDKDKLEAFSAAVTASRKSMIEAMRKGAEAIEGKDSKLASTLESMVSEL